MAKTGVFEGDQGMLAKVNELKKELYKAVKLIGEDDINVEAIDIAQEMLSALKGLKLQRSSSSVSLNLQNEKKLSMVVPEEFKCPLSKELMKDPVIVSSGLTFDRPYIQKWLKSGNLVCPQTQQVLSHSMVTPNLLIREMISQWCKKNRIKLPDPVQYSKEEGLTEADRVLFLSLLDKLSKTMSDQKEAAKQLRLLTRRTPSFRAMFGESSGALSQLLNPLARSKSTSDVHPDLQEDIITTVLNLSIHDNNKKLVAETPMVIPILIDALRSGTIETRTNAAAALFTLSALDSNKELIGKSGALKPLIDLLGEGHSLSMKDVASAIFTLCILHENRARAVRDGAVQVILRKIANRVYMDELLAILAMLSNNQRAVEELADLGAVSCLLSIMRETSCARNQENCIAILYTICFNDRSKWKELREEERAHATISQLGQNGTSRAKRKASGILERLNRAMHLTHTA